MAAGTDEEIRVATRINCSFENHHKKHLSNKAAELAIRGFIVLDCCRCGTSAGGCVAPVQPSLLT
jgi:hypothetical protein